MSLFGFFTASGAGAMNSLTTLCPVAASQEHALSAQLDALDPAASPFARHGPTHFARFVLVPPGAFDHTEPPPPPKLLFSAVFRGERDRYLEALTAAMPDEAHAVWSHCDGYVDVRSDPAGFRAFLLDRVVRPVFRAAAYDAEPAEVRRALALRRALRELAQDRAQRTPAQLRAEFERIVQAP